jgi:ribose-phosphate pyrophosphokinase
VRDIAVFSGTAHLDLAREICGHLGVPLYPTRVERFANDCLEVQLQANCRERDVFLIQPLVPPVQEHLVELLLMLDAARGASAARTTVVMPHYAYARSDKKDAPRISIGGRLVADLLVAAGAGRILAMTLHSPQVHGFFSVPVDHLHALRELAGHFAGYDLSQTVVVSPDLGNAKPVTNTVPIPKPVPKLRVLSVAPALAEAMRRIHGGESVSALFA